MDDLPATEGAIIRAEWRDGTHDDLVLIAGKWWQLDSHWAPRDVAAGIRSWQPDRPDL